LLLRKKECSLCPRIQSSAANLVIVDEPTTASPSNGIREGRNQKRREESEEEKRWHCQIELPLRNRRSLKT
jgi:hypothetical protein